MASISHSATPGACVDRSTAALFQQDWNTYRKMVDNNYLFHREAYGRLHCILRDEVSRPFQFLDIACGDASAVVGALKGTQVEHYRGIDFSGAALDLARPALDALGCPVVLEECDFVAALQDERRSVDVVWISLSLHHLLAPAKLKAMRSIRNTIGERGHFLIYENAGPDGEDRQNWLRRWDEQEPYWTAYTKQEWQRAAAHVHAADFPETSSRWHSLGYEAGFRKVQEVFVAPTNLFRMYHFQP
jgi:ubiquinone/menaquinone biosynthesis C-methylase UbiE